MKAVKSLLPLPPIGLWGCDGTEYDKSERLRISTIIMRENLWIFEDPQKNDLEGNGETNPTRSSYSEEQGVPALVLAPVAARA